MITAARHMISAGHYLATEAGRAVLEAGGNAVDAGVAAGIALGVVHSDQVQCSGVAPMIISSHKPCSRSFSITLCSG
jgi:gamma-glutamyltranspeptidase/glutathione hydrolase